MEKGKNKIILIENGSPREIDQEELNSIKTEADSSKNGVSIMYMKEDSEREGCAVYRRVRKLIE